MKHNSDSNFTTPLLSKDSNINQYNNELINSPFCNKNRKVFYAPQNNTMENLYTPIFDAMHSNLKKTKKNSLNPFTNSFVGFPMFFKSFALTLVIIFAGIGGAWGQTALITASDGGFENATAAFANNGWTAVGTSARTWRVGTFGGAATGTKAAYWGTTTAYGGAAAAAVGHFYRDIVIPVGATNVFLNYKLKYPIIDNTYDYFYVFTTTTANTPVNAVIPTTGYTQRFVNTASTFAAFTAMPQVDLTALAGTTVRLVFTFKTDAVTPNAAPAVDDITLTYVVGSPCSGTPNPGNTVTSSSTASSGSTVNLSLQNATSGTGVTYQWQSGPTNTGAWTNIGTSAANYVATISATTWYRCIVTCSGVTGTSAPVQVTLSYCTPVGSTTYYVSNFNTTGGITNIANTTGASAGGYGNYSATLSCSQYANSSITFNLTASPSSTYYYYVWIDWNNDLDFLDAGETVVATTTYAASYSGAYTVPNGTPASGYRMRIANSYIGAIGSCGPATYGEYEDYTFNVLALVPCAGTPAPGNTLTSSASVAIGGTVNLTLSTPPTGSGLTYQWQSGPTNTGAWTNIGTSAATYVATISATTWYRCIVTCSGVTGTSAPVQVTAVVANNIPFTGSSSVACGTSTLIYDHAGASTDYSINANGYLVLNNNVGSTSVISLTGTYTTEASWDFLRIYDGTGTAGTLIASYSGSGTITPFTSAAGQTITVQFTSDVSTNGAGISLNAVYSGSCSVPSCSGTPNTATATITSAGVCPNVNFTLNSSGYSTGTGIIYQWQTSANGTTGWANVGAAGTSLTTSTATTAYYKLVTTCTSSGLSNSSNVVSYTVSGNACACTVYPASNATSAADDEILNVTVGTLNNTSTCASLAGGAGSVVAMYSNYTGAVAAPSLLQTATISGSVTIGFCGGLAYTTGFAVYIDYNQNGSFADPGEMVYSPNATVTAALAGTAFPFTFTVPVTATPGITRMRIVNSESVALPLSTGTYSWGETEDYCVTIAAAAVCSGTPAPGATTSTSTMIVAANNFTLSMSTPPQATGLSYNWQSSTNGTTWPAISTIINTDFSSLPGSTSIYGTASVAGGELILTPNAGSSTGGFVINTSPGSNINSFVSNFDYRIFDGGGADGFSLSYAPTVAADAGGGEAGEGTGLVVSFDTYSTFTQSQVIVKYGGTQIFANTAGAYNLRNTSYRNINVSVNESGELNVSIAGTAIVNGLALPGYTSANKSTWNFKFSARTGGLSDKHSIDNLVIKMGAIAINSTYTTAESSSLYYQCIVTCSAGGSAASTPVFVALYPYCVPTMYPTNTNYYINSVTTSGAAINITSALDTGFTSTIAPGVSYFASPIITQNQGGSFTLAVQAVGATSYFSVWVDWNKNNIFESSELMVNNVSCGNTATNFTINVPVTATLGNTSMRIIDWTSGPAPGVCDNLSGFYGETEDYKVCVTAGLPPVVSSFSPSPICPGNTVTITGSNFYGVSGVTINSVAATYTVVSTTSITAIVPSTTSGPIVVTNTFGASTGGGSLTINSAPATPVISVSPSATIGLGGTATLTASTTGGTINWYKPMGTLVGTGTTFTTTASCTPGTNTYYAQEAAGVSACPSIAASTIITVSSLITSSSPLTGAPNNGIICNTGGSVNLNANVVGGSGFNWSPSTNLSSTNTALTTASPTVTTAYTFSCTTAACGALSGTFNVGVIVGASFTPTATPPTLCSGNTSVLASNLLASGFAATAITYSASVASSPTVLTNAGTAVVAPTSCVFCPLDDAGWANIPIGFSYNFFGASYSSLNVGSNSNIQFGTYNGSGAGGLGDYTFANTLPNNTEPLNMVAGAAVDLHPGLGGILRYWTEGIAPTRMFVVEWNAVPGFGSNGSNTAQIKLFETTGNVEVHVLNSSSTSQKVVGLQNFDASIGTTAISTTAVITSSAWRFIPGATYSFQWTTGGSAAPGSSTSTTYTTPTLNTPGAIPYSVSATNPNTQCAAVQSLTVTVNQTPTAPISGGNITACSNASPAATISATAPIGCVIDWYNSSNTLLLSASSTYTPTVSGTYYAKARNSTSLCASAPTAITFTQNAAPLAPTATTSLSLCQFANASPLTATATAGNTLNWYTSVGGTASSTAPTPSTAATGTTNYWVSQTSGSNGCIGPNIQISVLVLANPLAPVATSPITYCQNVAASPLTATATAGNTLSWYTSVGGTSSPTALTPSTTTAGSTDYYVAQVSASNCSSPLTTISVIVNPTLIASVSNSASSTSACGGGAIVFTAIPANTGTAPTYQWYKNGVLQNGETALTYTVAAPIAGDVVYVAMTSNASPCLSVASVTSNSVTLSGSPSTPSVSIASVGPATVCFGSPITFNVSASSNAGSNPTYQWQISGYDVIGETNATFTTPDLWPGDSVSLVLTSSLDSACLTAYSDTSNAVLVNVLDAVFITTDPVSASSCLSGTVVFTVAATGSGTLGYQWQKNGVNITTNPTANTSSLTITGITNADAANYSVIVTGTCGSISSNVASLSIDPATVISTQPAAIIACNLSSATFSVTATGVGLTYQWRKNGANISSANLSTYTLASVTSADAGNYSVVVSGACGNQTSGNALLTINPSVSISTQPTPVTTCDGNIANFAISASGTAPITYKWKLNNQVIIGATASTYSVIASAATAGNYTCLVTSGCGSLTSAAALLTVNPNTAITVQPVSIIACAGGSATFSLTASGTGTLTYQWKFNGVGLANSNSNSYTINTVTSAELGQYTCYISGGTCGNGSATSNAVTLTMLPVYNAGATPSTVSHVVISQVFGGGGNAGATYTNDFVELYNPTANSVSLASFSLQYASAAGTSWTKFNLTGSIASGAYYLIQGAAATNPVGVALPTANISFASLDLAIANSKVALISNQTVIGVLSCPTSIVDFVGYGTANCSEGSSAVAALTTTTAAIRKGSGGVDTDVNSADFTVGAPTPHNSATIPQANQTFCATGTPNFMILNGSTGSGSFSYQWYSQSGIVAAPTGSSVSGWTSLGTVDGANTALYTPTSPVTASVTYACFVTPGATPTCGAAGWAVGCRQVTINPLPVVGISATSTSVCVGNNPVTLSGTGATTYSWSGGISNGVAFVPSLSTTYTVTGTNSATGCINTATQLITVNALPVVGISATSTSVCAGNTVTLSGTGATTYSWSGGISDGVAFVPSLSTTYTVTGTNSATSCTNTATQLITVDALPLGTASPSTQAICSGNFVLVNLGTSNNLTGTTFNWVRNNTTNVTSSGPTSGTGNTLIGAGQLTSNTLVAETVVFTVTPIGPAPNNCAGSPFNVTITVSPTSIPVVTVNSTPVVLSSASAFVYNDLDSCGAVVHFVNSNSNVTSFSVLPTNDTTYLPGITSFTLTSINAFGCSVTYGLDLEVVDNQVPTVSSDTLLVAADIGQCYVSKNLIPTPEVTDNCGVASYANNAGSTVPVGTSTLSWSISDIGGNSVIQNIVLIVEDQQSPVVSGISPVSYIVTSGNCSSVSSSLVSLGNVIATDNCGILSLTNDAPSTYLAGVTDVTWTATDIHGNTTTAIQVVTVTAGTPTTPASITGSTIICTTGVNVVYSTPAIVGALGYNWSVTSAATIVSGQGTNTLTVNYASTLTTAVISVSAYNGCGSSLSKSVQVKQPTAPLTPGTISGPTTNICSGTANYSVVAVVGAVSYAWTVPTGVTITSGQGTNSIVVSISGGFTSGSVSVTSNNGCASSTARTLTISTTSQAPGLIAGPTTNICVSTTTYSVVAVAGAVSYTWTVPSGVTITSGQGTNSIVVSISAGFTSGSVTVTSYNGCSTSPVSSLSISNLATIPGVITGPTSNICGTTSTYSIASVIGAVSYSWTVPVGATISSGQGTTSITVALGSFTSGNVSVKTYNGCIYSAIRSLAISNSIPALGVISGPTTNVCSGSATYSVATVAGATSYTWTVPTGVSITSGQTTNSIIVSVTNSLTTGNITVYATNACGISTAVKTLAISNTSTAPVAITGPSTNVCASTATYSVALVVGASSYTWTVPTGVSITSGQGTNSIGVSITIPGFTSGNVTVYATNACGKASAVKTLAISNTTATPGVIAGPTSNLCPLVGTITYSVTPVAGAVSYSWTAPLNSSIVSGSGTNVIGVTFNSSFVSGTFSVTASNGCTVSVVRTLAVTKTPATPGVITGATTALCGLTNVSYSVALVSGASSYNWVVPSGATIASGQGTNSILVNFGITITSGSIGVSSVASCGSSAARTLTLVNCSSARMGMNESGNDLFISDLYPNPCSQTTYNLDLESAYETQIVIEMFDAIGRLVESKIESIYIGKTTIVNNINFYKEGIYFIRITDKTTQQTEFKKLILQGR